MSNSDFVKFDGVIGVTTDAGSARSVGEPLNWGGDSLNAGATSSFDRILAQGASAPWPQMTTLVAGTFGVSAPASPRDAGASAVFSGGGRPLFDTREDLLPASLASQLETSLRDFKNGGLRYSDLMSIVDYAAGLLPVSSPTRYASPLDRLLDTEAVLATPASDSGDWRRVREYVDQARDPNLTPRQFADDSGWRAVITIRDSARDEALSYGELDVLIAEADKALPKHQHHWDEGVLPNYKQQLAAAKARRGEMEKTAQRAVRDLNGSLSAYSIDQSDAHLRLLRDNFAHATQLLERGQVAPDEVGGRGDAGRLAYAVKAAGKRLTVVDLHDPQPLRDAIADYADDDNWNDLRMRKTLNDLVAAAESQLRQTPTNIFAEVETLRATVNEAKALLYRQDRPHLGAERWATAPPQQIGLDAGRDNRADALPKQVFTLNPATQRGEWVTAGVGVRGHFRDLGSRTEAPDPSRAGIALSVDTRRGELVQGASAGYLRDQIAPLANLYYFRGDEGKRLRGVALDLEVGISLGLLPDLAPPAGMDNVQVYDDADKLAVIGAVTDALYRIGGEAPDVTALPVLVRARGEQEPKLTVLFRENRSGQLVALHGRGTRVYRDLEDWKQTNPHDVVDLYYPKDGRLSLDAQGYPEMEVMANRRFDNTVKPVVDAGAHVAGVVSTFVPGAQAFKWLGAAIGAYDMVNNGADLVTRARHQESLSLADPGARQSWLGFVTGVGNAAGMGGRALSLATGSKAAMRVTGAVSTAASAVDMAAFVDSSQLFAREYAQMDWRKRFETGAMLAWQLGSGVASGIDAAHSRDAASTDNGIYSQRNIERLVALAHGGRPVAEANATKPFARPAPDNAPAAAGAPPAGADGAGNRIKPFRRGDGAPAEKVPAGVVPGAAKSRTFEDASLSGQSSQPNGDGSRRDGGDGRTDRSDPVAQPDEGGNRPPGGGGGRRAASNSESDDSGWRQLVQQQSLLEEYRTQLTTDARYGQLYRLHQSAQDAGRALDLSRGDYANMNLSLFNQVVPNAFANANFADAILRRATLDGLNLFRVNLEGADIADASLRRADLRGANLKGANLSKTNVSDANLQGASLESADLSDADFSGANLWDVKLAGARLETADLSGAQLGSTEAPAAAVSDEPGGQAGADEYTVAWQNALDNGYLFTARESAILAGDARYQDIFRRAREAQRRQRPLQLPRADLRGLDISLLNRIDDVNFRAANLVGANLAYANLSAVDLATANLTGADLSDSDLRGANLAGAILVEANFRGAKVEGANFWQANLEGAIRNEDDITILPDVAASEPSSRRARGFDAEGRLQPPTDAQRALLPKYTLNDGIDIIPTNGYDSGLLAHTPTVDTYYGKNFRVLSPLRGEEAKVNLNKKNDLIFGEIPQSEEAIAAGELPTYDLAHGPIKGNYNLDIAYSKENSIDTMAAELKFLNPKDKPPTVIPPGGAYEFLYGLADKTGLSVLGEDIRGIVHDLEHILGMTVIPKFRFYTKREIPTLTPAFHFLSHLPVPVLKEKLKAAADWSNQFLEGLGLTVEGRSPLPLEGEKSKYTLPLRGVMNPELRLQKDDIDMELVATPELDPVYRQQARANIEPLMVEDMILLGLHDEEITEAAVKFFMELKIDPALIPGTEANRLLKLRNQGKVELEASPTRPLGEGLLNGTLVVTYSPTLYANVKTAIDAGFFVPNTEGRLVVNARNIPGTGLAMLPLNRPYVDKARIYSGADPNHLPFMELLPLKLPSLKRNEDLRVVIRPGQIVSQELVEYLNQRLGMPGNEILKTSPEGKQSLIVRLSFPTDPTANPDLPWKNRGIRSFTRDESGELISQQSENEFKLRFWGMSWGPNLVSGNVEAMMKTKTDPSPREAAREVFGAGQIDNIGAKRTAQYPTPEPTVRVALEDGTTLLLRGARLNTAAGGAGASATEPTTHVGRQQRQLQQVSEQEAELVRSALNSFEVVREAMSDRTLVDIMPPGYAPTVIPLTDVPGRPENYHLRIDTPPPDYYQNFSDLASAGDYRPLAQKSRNVQPVVPFTYDTGRVDGDGNPIAYSALTIPPKAFSAHDARERPYMEGKKGLSLSGGFAQFIDADTPMKDPDAWHYEVDDLVAGPGDYDGVGAPSEDWVMVTAPSGGMNVVPARILELLKGAPVVDANADGTFLQRWANANFSPTRQVAEPKPAAQSYPPSTWFHEQARALRAQAAKALNNVGEYLGAESPQAELARALLNSMYNNVVHSLQSHVDGQPLNPEARKALGGIVEAFATFDQFKKFDLVAPPKRLDYFDTPAPEGASPTPREQGGDAPDNP